MSERSFYDKNEPKGGKHTAPEKQTSSTVFMFLLFLSFHLRASSICQLGALLCEKNGGIYGLSIGKMETETQENFADGWIHRQGGGQIWTDT